MNENVSSADLPKQGTISFKNREPYSTLLSKATLELKSNPELQIPEHMVFESRAVVWRKVRAISRKNTARTNCSLCNADTELHSQIWHAYGLKKDVAGAVRVAQDGGISDVTPTSLRKHITSHNYAQPAPLKRIKPEESLLRVSEIKERDQEIILHTYRQRVLSSRQIAEIFFLVKSKNLNAATKNAYITLHQLRFNHFLYQYKSNRTGAETYYFLGRNAAPWVEKQEGRLVGSPYITSVEEINEYLLEHDIQAADIFVQLRKKLYTKQDPYNIVKVFDEDVTPILETNGWHGSRSLPFLYFDPLKNFEVKIIPDGFAAVTLHGSINSQIPFFYEWDSGSKQLEDTVQQIVNYTGFSMSGVIKKRFPSLQTGGKDYRPPVLWVTSNPSRAYNIYQAAKQELAKHAPDTIPLTLITDRKTLENSAYKEQAWHIIHDGGKKLKGVNVLELLLEGSQELLEGGGILPGLPIDIDINAARPNTAVGKK